MPPPPRRSLPREYHTRPAGLIATVVMTVAVGLVAAACTTTGPSTPTGAGASSTAPISSSWPSGVLTLPRDTVQKSAEGKRIALVSPDATDSFSSTVTESIIEQLGIAGAELIRCDPGYDGQFALDCARRLAAQQVDGWIVQRTAREITESLCAAGPRDVPMIVVDGAPGSCTTATIGAADRDAGVLTGRGLGAVARADDCRFDSFVLIDDPRDPIASEARAEGIRSGLRESCPQRLPDPFVAVTSAAQSSPSTSTDPTAVSSVAAERQRVTVIRSSDQKDVFDAVQRAVGAQPDSHHILIAAVSDGPALTALAAVRALDRLDDVQLAGIGAEHRVRCEIVGTAGWVGDAALFPERYGRVVVPSLVDAIDGRAVARAMLLQPTFLDAAGIRSTYDLSSCEETG